MELELEEDKAPTLSSYNNSLKNRHKNGHNVGLVGSHKSGLEAAISLNEQLNSAR